MSPLRVGVVGGGIGGLAAALSLLRAGFDVQVYEQARELGEVGAGIQISPNASRVLHGLGLADELASMGVRPLAWHQRRWDDGRTLLHTPLAGLADRGERVEARFSGDRRVEVDVLVGADGIHSTGRGLLLGPEAPNFTGCAAYRGLVPAERVRDLGLEVEAQVWLGPGAH